MWPARLSSAQSIVVVQPDPNIIKVLQSHRSRVLDDPRIRVVVTEPRAFLDTTRSDFDIIHLAGLEGFSPGSGGIGGLQEDYLATVEGFAQCLGSLSPTGMACVVRGIQDPARDNIKIPATWIEALEKRGVARPGDHLLITRDELSMATLVSASPVDNRVIRRFRDTCTEMNWDPEWFPGIRGDETNRVHVLPGPEGSSTSWVHHALTSLLSRNREDFYRNWIANVRPATDDSPFFRDFFRWASIGKLRQAFGPLWPARSEMGFLVLLMAAVCTALTALILLPGPMLLLWRARDAPRRR